MYVSGNISNTENIPCVIMKKGLNKQQSGKCKSCALLRLVYTSAHRCLKIACPLSVEIAK